MVTTYAAECVALAQLQKCTLVSTDKALLKRVGDFVPTATVEALTYSAAGLREPREGPTGRLVERGLWAGRAFEAANAPRKLCRDGLSESGILLEPFEDDLPWQHLFVFTKAG